MKLSSLPYSKKLLRMSFIAMLLIINGAVVPRVNITLASPATFFYVDPREVRTVQPSDTFSIKINVSDAPSTYSWEVYLSWDRTLLNVSGIKEGDFLHRWEVDPFDPKVKYPKYSTSFAPTPLNESNLKGEMLVYCTLIGRLPMSDWANGTGTLFSLNFTVTANGRSVLNLFNTRLWDHLDGTGYPAPTYYPNEDGSFYTTYPRASFYYLPNGTAPALDYTPDPTLLRNPAVGETITFNASAYMLGSFYRGSYDPDGEIVSYSWDFGDGTTKLYVKDTNLTATTTHAYAENKTYTVTLTVTDNKGKTDTHTEDVSVHKRDVAISSILVFPTIVSPGESVSVKVTLVNMGSESENFNVTAYYYNTTLASLIVYNQTETVYKPAFSAYLEKVEVGGQPTRVQDLFTPGTRWNVTFTWNTTNLALGQYNIKANVTLMQKQTYNQLINNLDSDLANNQMLLENEVTLSKLHNLAVTNIKISPTFKPPAILLYGTAQVTVNVTVTNTGDFGETFNVTLYQDSTLLKNWTDVSLAAKTTTILEYTWHTALLPIGNYILKAQTSNVTGEVEQGRISDNTLTLKVSITTYPVASFTYTPTMPAAGELTRFDATSSCAAEGWTIVSYKWKFGDYSPPSMAEPTYTYIFPLRDTYNVTLTVTDNLGLTGSTFKLIYVGTRPVASFSYSPAKPFVGGTVRFDASASYAAPSFSIANYTWTFNQSQAITTTEPIYERVFSDAGTYKVTLNVTDNIGLTQSASQFIYVGTLPTAHFTFSPSSPKADEPITFDASPSTPNGGTLENYKWNFGDGNITTVSNPTIVHSYAKSGNFSVTLTVSDSEGLNDTITQSIIIKKLISNISINASSPSITTGGSVTISGSINPTRARVSVTIWQRLKETQTWNNITAVQTNENSQYTFEWKPTTPGNYEVKASWEGDTNTLGDESDIQTITVREAATPSIPLLVMAGIAIIIIAAIVIYIIKFRKPD